jgi:hypothetical protein
MKTDMRGITKIRLILFRNILCGKFNIFLE